MTELLAAFVHPLTLILGLGVALELWFVYRRDADFSRWWSENVPDVPEPRRRAAPPPDTP